MVTAGGADKSLKADEAGIGQFHHKYVDNANIHLRRKPQKFTHSVFTSRMNDAFIDTVA
jgi:hypothetical protein